MTNFDTVREALELATPHYQADTERFKQALSALAEIERTHYTAEDVADASAQGFRDGVASVTAGQEPVAWLVCSVNSDGSLSLEHAAAWKEAAHEHINDAIAEHGIEEAASWVVRPAYVAAPVAQQPHVPEADCGNIDWKDMYEKQKRRAEMWIAKYEADIGPLETAGPVAQQPQEPDWKHPKIQALIGADARNRIAIDLIWQILKDPDGNFSAMDMEYWDSIHDAVQAAVMKDQQPQAETVPAGYRLVMVPDAAPGDEPDWDECIRQAEVATGIKVERHTISIVIREVRRWLAHRQSDKAALQQAEAVLPGWTFKRLSDGSIGIHAPAPKPGEKYQRTSDCVTPGHGDTYEILSRLVDHLEAPQQAEAVPPDPRPVIEMCAKALAEELAAWDIDPPLHHVKEASDACGAWLAAAPKGQP